MPSTKTPLSPPDQNLVSGPVRKRILAELASIEKDHGVKVLFACESGSRGWGFASPDSDYDVRFLYVHPLEWYLRIDAQRDVIEVPISKDLDISGWELRKALQLLRRSNPTLLEWLDSPVVYREQAPLTDSLRALIPDFFSPMRGRHHYLSMARRQFRAFLQKETIRHKKYFYVLRPLLAVRWIDSYQSMPPMRFADLVAGTVKDANVMAEINALLELKKRAREAAIGPVRPCLQAFIESEFMRADFEPDYKIPANDAVLLDRFFSETILAL